MLIKKSKRKMKRGKVVEIEILDASKLLGGFLAEIIKSPKREIVEIL